MTGHGEKLSRKQELAIVALLAQPSIGEAAKAAGVGEKTLWRWLQKEGFQRAYQNARRRVVDQAIVQVQTGMTEAVQTLREIMNEKKSSPSARVSAARAIIGFGFQAVEVEDLEKRIAELEAHTGIK